MVGGGGCVTTNFGGVDVVPLITQKSVFAIGGLCWYNFFFLKETTSTHAPEVFYNSEFIALEIFVGLEKERLWSSKTISFQESMLVSLG